MIKHISYHNAHLQDMLIYENEIWALTMCDLTSVLSGKVQ
jgi:hypothetical protein